MIDLVWQRLRDLVKPQAGWLTLAAAVALAVVGIAAIGTVEPGFAKRQMLWLAVSLVAAGVCMIPHPRVVGMLSYPLLGVTTALLIFVLLPFVPRSIVPVINGARSWIDLGFMNFQPSEMAKITFVMAMAWYLRHRKSYRTLRGLLVPFAIMFVPLGLILKEPDLGSALLLPPALMAMLVAAGAKLRHLGALVGLGLLVIVVNVGAIYLLPDSMQLLKPHQRDRIRALVSQVQGDTRYIHDIGYQQHKAMTLIGAAGPTGYGQRATTIIRHNRLPYDHNDMIFVVVVNRWGLAGGLGVLGLYVLLFLSMMLVAGRSRDPFARLTTVGFAGLFMTQMTINVGITLGLLPVTGITLPLVSYGGSSLVASFCMVGIVANVGSRRPAMLNWPSFEFDRKESLA